MANILVIDDEPILLDLISASLKLDGHHVTAISDPMSAWDAIEKGEGAFALILTDVDMKPISGFEIVNQLNGKGWHGAVLFMSGHPALSATIADSIGVRDIIEKPFTARQLRTAVAEVLSRSGPKARNTAN